MQPRRSYDRLASPRGGRRRDKLLDDLARRFQGGEGTRPFARALQRKPIGVEAQGDWIHAAKTHLAAASFLQKGELSGLASKVGLVSAAVRPGPLLAGRMEVSRHMLPGHVQQSREKGFFPRVPHEVKG